MAIIGIDEAGRGPVFGSLFVAGVRFPDDHPILSDVRESKSTTKNQIFATARAIHDSEDVQSIIIEISASELTEAENITTETANAMIQIASELTEGEDSVFVDSCFKDTEEFAEYFPNEQFSEIVVEHKADENYPVVSAAGCMAKFHREMHVEELNSQYEQAVGSGYPSDTTTRKFLKEYYAEHEEFPSETRLSWSTCETLREEAEQSDLNSF